MPPARSRPRSAKRPRPRCDPPRSRAAHRPQAARALPRRLAHGRRPRAAPPAHRRREMRGRRSLPRLPRGAPVSATASCVRARKRQPWSRRLGLSCNAMGFLRRSRRWSRWPQRFPTSRPTSWRATDTPRNFGGASRSIASRCTTSSIERGSRDAAPTRGAPVTRATPVTWTRTPFGWTGAIVGHPRHSADLQPSFGHPGRWLARIHVQRPGAVEILPDTSAHRNVDHAKRAAARRLRKAVAS